MSTPSQPLHCPPYPSAHPLSAIRLIASAQSGAQGPPWRTSTPFPGCPSTGWGEVRLEGAGPGHWGLIEALQPAGKAVGGALVLYLTRGWRLPAPILTHDLLPAAPWRGWGGGLQGVGAWARALTTPRRPQAPLTPHPLSAQPGCWRKEEKLLGLLGPPTHPTV